MAYFTGNVAYRLTVSSDIDKTWTPIIIHSENLKRHSVSMLSLTSFSIIQLDIEILADNDTLSISFDFDHTFDKYAVNTVVIKRITNTIENMINIGILECKFKDQHGRSTLDIINPGLFVKGCTYQIQGQIVI